MDYQESLEYLLRFADYERLPRSGIVWDIKRIERLLERLGDPQYSAKTVHVTGTKGKGSTSAIISAILVQAGYETGFFSSPHLLSFTERIQVNGKPIAEKEWARLAEDIKPHVEAENVLGDLGELTTFEIMTAMAFLCFHRKNMDYQVMEVGLGGRIDSTNVVNPKVCVLTSISYDHMDVLGQTLTEIAGEKAGIIKPGATAISAPQFPEAMKVIEKICREKDVRLVKAGVDVTWNRGDHDNRGQSFHLNGLKREYDLAIPLLGEHQIENAAIAVAAAETLEGSGAKISSGDIVNGLLHVNWPGRLQILRYAPMVVVDGAHNRDSIQKLGKSLKQYLNFNKLKLILGFSGDKDVLGMVHDVTKISDDIILVASRHPRSVKTEKLVNEFNKYSIKPRVAENVSIAVKTALSEAGKDDLICAAGSVFVIAEVMEEMRTE